MSKRAPFPAEVRERAVRMVLEVTPEHDSQWAAIRSVAPKMVASRLLWEMMLA